MTTVNATTVGSPRPAIITPLIDTFCSGGFSLLLMGGFMLYALFLPNPVMGQLNLEEVLFLAAVVNWPHFMASYRLLYCSRENVTRHKWASIYVPGFLVLYLLVAVMVAGDDPSRSPYMNKQMYSLLFLVSIFYLAWHYTGQAWGMTASFTYINQQKMDSTDRRLIRIGLRVLLAWHVVWATQPLELPASWHSVLLTAHETLSVLALLSIPLGVYGFWRIARRSGRPPAVRAVLPWGTMYLWYLLVNYYPSAFFWLQISHALQYLIFPMRVEMNRQAALDASAPSRGHHSMAGHMALYYMTLIALGLAVFKLPEVMLGSRDPFHYLAIAIAAAVNIHHYFVDGCIWKISNPQVREDLFGHLAAR